MVAVSRRRRTPGLVALVVVGVLVLLAGAWGVDSAVHAEGAPRNLAVAGTEVGGLSEAELDSALAGLGDDQRDRPVTVVTPASTLETTADELGLAVDVAATRQRVLDHGDDRFLLLRPFLWLASLVAEEDVEPVYEVDEDALEQAVAELVAANLTPPVEPAIAVAGGDLVATPGQPGTGVTASRVAAAVLAAAGASDAPTAPITVRLDAEPIAPRFADADAQRVAEEAAALASAGLAVTVDGRTTEIPADTLETWMRAVPDQSGDELVVGIDPSPVEADVTAAVGTVGTPPVELSWSVGPDGSVGYVPGRNGTKCCAADSPQRVVDALRSGAGTVTLDLTTAAPTHDAAWAERMNVRQPIASFTTPHACCESRVQNIHRMADLVRGTLVEPGQTFSLNGHVGPRTTAKGFTEAGVIYNGRFTNDVGGGVSQFTTTLFNAAFFGGMDFVEYQAHTIYISRYPYGREATLSYPAPDLKITNTSPFGILVWPTYTDTSITVTLYSSPWVTADQTGQQRQAAGRCTRVLTERTRTFLIDGRREVDTVSATYQPAEGVLC